MAASVELLKFTVACYIPGSVSWRYVGRYVHSSERVTQRRIINKEKILVEHFKALAGLRERVIRLHVCNDKQYIFIQ